MYKLDDSVYNELIRYETIYNFIYNSIVKYIRNKYSIDSLNAQLKEKWCQNRLNHYKNYITKIDENIKINCDKRIKRIEKMQSKK